MAEGLPMSSPGAPEAEVDVAVIGAGVVGLAVAAILSRRRSVAVIERHASYGLENSSHNSGVIHAGIYYPPHWLKTTLCVEGNRLLYAWTEEHGVKARRVGKLIVAVGEEELPALHELTRAAEANGVPELRLLEGRELRSLEPTIRAVAALFSGSSGVVDQMGLMRSYLQVARGNGAYLAFKHEVTNLQRREGGFLVRMGGPAGDELTISAASVVNSAGLAAERLGASLGYDPDGGEASPPFRQTINKGRYYDIVNTAKAARICHPIYPLPHLDRAGLGIHLTLDVDGGVHLGPDTEWLEDGARLDFRADDEGRLRFLQAARRYLPDLSAEDLAPGQVGYRPKLHRPGQPPRDFLIWHDQGYVHLGGIESPGMTASPAIARRVAGLLGVDAELT
jgi:L-2-hydroxyglutarate oxidase LhgO